MYKSNNEKNCIKAKKFRKILIKLQRKKHKKFAKIVIILNCNNQLK